ncbi:hypothetical protein C8A00DRAFT_31914 [Chaetomidium leptoderma]|uniref:Zn(2)-C6 fungal-type domain-containing protein n=1 Tax=Chaetomidium leptoderma TaxID=669021 RepID=A0AAN6VPQ5_9PEZI|nr:hypothetical protein C8A00DRAFT_31914 [Chaetomidium leptoderma]
MSGYDDSARSFRPLLPRPQPAGDDSVDADAHLPSKRPHTRNACEDCRRRKTKCDGKRPICSTCTSNGGSCTFLSPNPDESRSSAIKRKYDEAQDRVSNHEELYTLLKTRSQAEATEMLHRIRAGVAVDSILRYV